MPLKFDIRGANETVQVFKALPFALQKTALDSAVRAGARVLAKGMRRRAPRRQTPGGGVLAKGIIVTKFARTRPKKPGLIFVGFVKPNPSRRAHLTEYGTRHSAAFPFMRPTLAEDGPEAVAKTALAFEKNLEKVALELAGRFGSIRKSTRRRL